MMKCSIDYEEMCEALLHNKPYRVPTKYLILAKQAVKAKFGFNPRVVMDDGEFAIIVL